MAIRVSRFVLACLVAAAIAVPSQRSVAQTQPTPVLLELFTSEGCSSCPPADRLLIDLVRTQPVPGVRIVGLSEHVDYWNHLGWKDPFSDALFSRRQERYANGTTDGSYTPQMVIDGAAGIVGSDRTEAIRAIRTAASQPKAALTLGWTTATRDAVDVTVAADPRIAKARVWLAITEDGLRSSVRRGENEGHELVHDAVTRRLLEIGSTDASGAFHAIAPIALDRSWNRAALHFIAFLQRPNGRIAGVATVSFP